MKRFISDCIKISLFISLHVACAMQEHKHHHVHRRPSQAIVEQKENIIAIDLEVQETERRQISDEREQVRYSHRRKLAILTLVSSVVGCITTVIYILVKK